MKNPLSLNVNEIKKITHPLFLLDWTTQKGELFKAMKIEKYIMFLFLFLVLLVSILNIVVILTICTVEKQNAVAILQTQGLLNCKIMLIFIIFGSSTAIIGNILGTLISLTLIIQNDFLKFFINIFIDETNIPIIVIPYQIFFINITITLFTILSTLYPSWKAIQLKPSRILSNE